MRWRADVDASTFAAQGIRPGRSEEQSRCYWPAGRRPGARWISVNSSVIQQMEMCQINKWEGGGFPGPSGVTDALSRPPGRAAAGAHSACRVHNDLALKKYYIFLLWCVAAAAAAPGMSRVSRDGLYV